jgi:hypothetical protein
MRRIKSVALSVPCVVGPYASVNCTLSLLRSSLRKSPLLKDGDYARQDAEDDRFVDYIGAVQSIVTSAATTDSGLFETNLRDERYLPFEGAGAESTWKLELPRNYRAFDYATIADAILHIRYTARPGVEPGMVNEALARLFSEQSDLALLFSLSHDFPTEWSAFVNGSGDFTATIRQDYFPYFAQGRAIAIGGLELVDGKNVTKHHPVGDPAAAASDLSGATRQFTLSVGPDAPGPMQVLKRQAGEEIFLVIRYSV